MVLDKPGSELELVPISEFISTSHKTESVRHWLSKVRDDIQTVSGRVTLPSEVTTDFSWAIIGGVSNAFNNENLT